MGNEQVKDRLRKFVFAPNSEVIQDDNMVYLQYFGRGHGDNSPRKRVVVYNREDVLGLGGSGTVYPGNPHILVRDDLYQARDSEKVIKVTENLDEQTRRNLESEYEYSKDIPHLKMKKPVFAKYGSYEVCCMVMKKVPGLALSILLNENKIAELSQPHKLKLTHNILLALQEQVTDVGLVHRDIKPGNIMVDPKNLDVKIIDYGIAKKQGEQKELLGTFGYIDPNLFEPDSYDIKQDHKSDVFSLARTIALLWSSDNTGYNHGKFNPCIDETNNAAKVFREKSTNAELTEWLANLLNPNQQARPSITEAIESFEQIYPDISDRAISPLSHRFNFFSEAEHMSEEISTSIEEVDAETDVSDYRSPKE